MSNKSQKHLNYDEIASYFDQRYVASPHSQRIQALLKLLELHNPQDILEVGCGTGHWLESLSGSSADLFGLDYSMGMLRRAKLRNAQISLSRGDAKFLPYQRSSFDLLFCIDALHHFGKPEQFLYEAWRVLRPGGIFALSGSDPHQEQEIWYVYDYFAGTREYDLQRFPSREIVLTWLAECGFQGTQLDLLERIENTYVGSQVWEDPFLKKNACSQLASLDDAAYQAGIRRIRVAIEEVKKRKVEITFRLVLPIHLITAIKPAQAT